MVAQHHEVSREADYYRSRRPQPFGAVRVGMFTWSGEGLHEHTEDFTLPVKVGREGR